MKQTIVPFFISHQGCPHRCIFCDQEKIAGNSGEFPSATEIRKRVTDYRRTSGSRQVEVAFYGGSFAGIPREGQDRLLSALREHLAVGEVSSIRVSTRPDTIDEATASFLLASGVRTVELGVQSMDDTVLRMAERGHGVEDVRKAVACLKEKRIAVGLQLMPGLPGETEEKSLFSFSRALGLRPDFVRVYPTVVVAGTPLARLYAQGRYRPLSLRDAVSLCKVLLHRALLAGVPVIRMGLQPTADLSKAGTIVAGPYHPAFRQMVEAELFFDLLDNLISPCLHEGEPVCVTCSPSRIADVVGQKRSNLRRLLHDRGVKVGKVRGNADLSPFEVIVEGRSGVRRGSLQNDLRYMTKEKYHV